MSSPSPDEDDLPVRREPDIFPLQQLMESVVAHGTEHLSLIFQLLDHDFHPPKPSSVVIRVDLSTYDRFHSAQR